MENTQEGRALVNKNVVLAVQYQADKILSNLDKVVNTKEIGRDDLMKLFERALNEVATVSFEEGVKESKCDNPSFSSKTL